MDSKSLAEQAVKLPGWRWQPGMRDTDGLRCRLIKDEFGEADWLWVPDDGCASRQTISVVVHHNAGRLPDLDDPATGGVLATSLGRQVEFYRWSDGSWSAVYFGPRAELRNPRSPASIKRSSLGAACVALACFFGRWTEEVGHGE